MKCLLFILLFNSHLFSQIMIIETDTTKYYFDIHDIKLITFDGLSDISSNPKALSNLATILRNIYPNPFVCKTNIEYSVDKYSLVKIDIFDLRGNLVEPLQSSFMDAGLHSIIWNGKDSYKKQVQSGTYLARVSINGKETIIKLILINKGD